MRQHTDVKLDKLDKEESHNDKDVHLLDLQRSCDRLVGPADKILCLWIFVNLYAVMSIWQRWLGGTLF
jgi:hypothetical protein